MLFKAIFINLFIKFMHLLYSIFIKVKELKHISFKYSNRYFFIEVIVMPKKMIEVF